jgi:predicted DNA-binding protein
MEEMELIRLSVNMSRETAESLTKLSRRQGVTKTEVIRRAVALMQFIQDESDSGRKIITMNSNEKKWRELVLG